MAAPKVESSNTRFFVLLGLAGIALVAWYSLRDVQGISLPTLPTWNWNVMASMAIISFVVLRIFFGVVKAITATDELDDDTSEDTSFEPHETQQRSEPDEPQRWDDTPVHERARILSWTSIALTVLFYPLGPIIGLIILRTYTHEDSTMVTVARVILILSLLLPLLFIYPIISIAMNP